MVGDMRMKPDKLALLRLNQTLGEVIEGTMAAGLKETAALLKMARLDLTLRMNAISEEELETMLFIVEARRPFVMPRGDKAMLASRSFDR
jgi:hypothetical protein